MCGSYSSEGQIASFALIEDLGIKRLARTEQEKKNVKELQKEI